MLTCIFIHSILFTFDLIPKKYSLQIYLCSKRINFTAICLTSDVLFEQYLKKTLKKFCLKKLCKFSIKFGFRAREVMYTAC